MGPSLGANPENRVRPALQITQPFYASGYEGLDHRLLCFHNLFRGAKKRINPSCNIATLSTISNILGIS